jgi:hypothetical protein
MIYAIHTDCHGIGRLLLTPLACSASAEGLTRLHGDILLTNAAMLRLARGLGMAVRPSGDGTGLMRAETLIPQTAARKPCVGMGAPLAAA